MSDADWDSMRTDLAKVLVREMNDPTYYVERRLESVHGYRATEIYLLRVDGAAAGTMQLIGDVDALGKMVAGKRYRIKVEEVRSPEAGEDGWQPS